MNKKAKMHVGKEGEVEISEYRRGEKVCKKNLTVNYAGCLYI